MPPMHQQPPFVLEMMGARDGFLAHLQRCFERLYCCILPKCTVFGTVKPSHVTEIIELQSTIFYTLQNKTHNMYMILDYLKTNIPPSFSHFID